ncbi:DgyrCDS11189 [Dimorphilus gyrociliatus]|uniref:DNA topoisomerase n=1 Tax=Dimorphilus gyrociliatus TaxID=2664684 RepID=A0A7I8W3W1_9ANNE|nr:DgyrCDS11189 [Dimorphilus gyrociliatus]
MIMTSVSGHLLTWEFTPQFTNWRSCNPVQLFTAPVYKKCPPDFEGIKKTLEREVRNCDKLVVWTDCDREGENIGFEVIEVCKKVKPNIPVYRAKFSEITAGAVHRAINNLIAPDEFTNAAVDVRSELDLRIGAAFTRFQTLRLQSAFPQSLGGDNNQLISYGSCQFPTLGFVVERYKQVEDFVPEPFWKIRVTHENDGSSVDFSWKRNRLFDYDLCLALYEQCIEVPIANVTDVRTRPKSKWRPVALDTVELEKLASRKLRINAKETMKIAEKLYTKGFISYPRTETNIFPKDLKFNDLIQQQTRNPNWGEFASRLLMDGANPRNGRKTDQAHPPIHPTKYADSLQGNEARVYEFVVRRFLACCSKDAQGFETTVDIEVNKELFTAQGLMITERNYLEVYPYDNWSDKTLPVYNVNDSFEPKSIDLVDGSTTAPPLLTEADLIALMEKHGIGTDATHAEHIETIKSRLYVGLRENKFVPGELGMGLVEGYDSMGFEMSKPHLRSELEADLKAICERRKNKDEVLQEQITKYKSVFEEAFRQASKLDNALACYFGSAQEVREQDYIPEVVEKILTCPACSSDMVLKKKKDNKGWFISCVAFPNCKTVCWLPSSVLEAKVTNDICDRCHSTKLMQFKFRQGTAPMHMQPIYNGCVVCDNELKDTLNFRLSESTVISPPNARNIATPVQSVRSSQQSRGSSSTTDRTRTVYPKTDLKSERSHGMRSFLGAQNASQNFGNVSDTVVCNCETDAKLVEVKKEGPNKGRKFYTCSTSNCRFFLWADEPKSSTQNDQVKCKCPAIAKKLTCKNGQNKGRPFAACPNDKCGFFEWQDTDSSQSHNQPSSQGFQSQSFQSQTQSRKPSMIGRSKKNYSGNTTQIQQSSGEDRRCACGEVAILKVVSKNNANKGRQFYSCPKRSCNFFEWIDEKGDNDNNLDDSVTRSAKKRKCGYCNEQGHDRRNCPRKT